MIRSRLYLWQNENWPEFRWDAEKLLSPIYEVSQEVSLLLGRISMFGEGIKTELLTSTLENEIISSNSVENILLKREAVRSSILAQLNMDTEGLSVNEHYSEGAVRILVDAVTNSVRLDKLMPLYLILWYIFKAKNTEKIGTCQIIDEK